MIDLASFRLSFPEFANISDDRVQYFIDKSISSLSIEVWGEDFNYNEGLNYLTASYLFADSFSIANLTTDPNIKREKIAELEVEYNVKFSDKFVSYKNSPYYCEFLRIRDMVVFKARCY